MASGFPPMPPHTPPPRRPRQQRQRVFVQHPPVINHPPGAWHHHVPYPYRFKIDGGWLFILALAVGGVVWKPLLLLALFIASLRIVIWLCFRFPLTSFFFLAILRGLFGRGRRW